ncbi:MAG TPA: hypothetical protein VL984_09505 [Acidimicrobiales bacterium]|nr:hypothetical protein [Acidimicrobiales bacterium]
MANTQWLDRTQPQTLYLATVLLYVDAFWWVLYLLFGIPLFGLLALPAIFCGLGIANEKKLGYWGAIAVAVVNVLILLLLFIASSGQSITVVMNLIFGAALLALLLHPMSRSYQHIWFKRLNINRNGPNRRYR